MKPNEICVINVKNLSIKSYEIPLYTPPALVYLPSAKQT